MGRTRVKSTILFVGAILAFLVFITSLHGDRSAKAAAPAMNCWASVKPPAGTADLRSIFALSDTNVWAIGTTGFTSIQHWNGTVWADLSYTGTWSSELNGVAGTAPDDIWTVGSWRDRNSSTHTLIEHWNGTGWSDLDSPDPGAGNIVRDTLNAVAAISRNDVWAVGSYLGTNTGSLTAHWDGNTWSQIPSPERGQLFGVSAIATNDVWAVGFYFDNRITPPGVQTYAIHWDGISWQETPIAETGQLNAVSMISHDGVWAVGQTAPNEAFSTATPLILHWDGKAWTKVSAPFTDGPLTSIASGPGGEVWAAGWTDPTRGLRHNEVVILHLNGTTFERVSTPGSTRDRNELYGLSITPGGVAWAVGLRGGSVGNTDGDLVLRHSPDTPCPKPPTRTPFAPLAPLPGEGSRFFPPTGKTVSGIFLAYWQVHGDLAQHGYPISEPMGEISDLDGKAYTVQYFERSVFEYHPENQPPNDVLLSQLGTFRYRELYGATPADEESPPYAQSIYFPETGKRLSDLFLNYWQAHGGVTQLGLPISNLIYEKSELDGNTYLVQYFERAVLEAHPENAPPYNVLQMQLGRFRYDSEYGK